MGIVAILCVHYKGAAVMDAADISPYAADAVEALHSLDLVGGKPAEDGRKLFDPKGQTTRAELASIWHQFVELLVRSSGE